jgi:outer membrane biosynthesis protein TonB
MQPVITPQREAPQAAPKQQAAPAPKQQAAQKQAPKQKAQQKAAPAPKQKAQQKAAPTSNRNPADSFSEYSVPASQQAAPSQQEQNGSIPKKYNEATDAMENNFYGRYRMGGTDGIMEAVKNSPKYNLTQSHGAQLGQSGTLPGRPNPALMDANLNFFGSN